MDFNESKPKFFADYLAVFILFSAIGYYIKKALAFLTSKHLKDKKSQFNK